MRPVHYVFDTCAGPSPLREDEVEPDWESTFHVSKKPRLRNVTNQNTEVIRTIMLYKRIGESFVRVLFGMVKTLADSIQL